jgi:CubicO group peptidase (beta-lactamase class C family)
MVLTLMTTSMALRSQPVSNPINPESKMLSACAKGNNSAECASMHRYLFKRIEEFVPIRTIDTEGHAAFVFPRAPTLLNPDQIQFDFRSPGTHTAVHKTVAQMLEQTHTDAFIVLKDGKIVYEHYFHGQSQRARHQMMSVTKSLVGLLDASLVAEGKLKRQTKVTDLIPELKGSAYEGATVGQVLDMTTGIRYSEAYDDPNAEVWTYETALGIRAASAGYQGPTAVRDFIKSLKQEGAHGKQFHYVTPNTDVACWLAERAAGVPFEKLMVDRFWSKLGMSRDAYVIVDPKGTAFCGGGLNATAVDLAKIGQMLLNNGQFNGQKILPAQAIAMIRAGGDRQAFAKSAEGQGLMKGWSYRDQFWIRHNANHAYTAIGIFGQWLYIDPTAKVVIVKQSSLPNAANDQVDAYTLAGFDAIIRSLQGG